MAERDVDGAIDLGNGHYARWATDGNLWWSHPECRSWHEVDVTSGTRHRLVKGGEHAAPVFLKIEPSIQCPDVPSVHGWIIDGRWVSA